MNPSTLLASTALSLPAQRTVKRALSLLEKYLREPGAVFTSTGAARDWLRLQLAGLEREVFVVVYLDNQHRLLACETLFTGSIRSTEVHPREVVKVALRHNAAAVILAHNHPSGMAEPSQADRIITDRVKTALALVDVHVLDHLIIGGLDVVSFVERGWLPG
ncbi:RadC family protein [Serratia fonticola]|uniref:RadC family protein n=1 Tax=Serratia fonticola TaxID=47917 RepID=UPI00040AC0A0|nr:DNA repair protein RadC [Serratia fonticola]CAI0977960.1 DNA repair protein RadC [Serratia fonticola]